ncbi:MAG: hypothetical protein ACK5AC_10975, partial [Planctomycetota bacterium]
MQQSHFAALSFASPGAGRKEKPNDENLPREGRLVHIENNRNNQNIMLQYYIMSGFETLGLPINNDNIRKY